MQITAFILIGLVAGTTGVYNSPTLFACSCGLLAAILSYFVGLAMWWWFIQLLFAPMLVMMLSVDLPPNLFLIAFLILLLTYWSTFRTQVPLYLSSHKVWNAIECLLPAKQGGARFNFLDLGSGLGGVLIYLAKVRPDGNYNGIEAAPLPFLLSWLRIRCGKYRNSNVHWGNLWNADLSQHDVVFAYLSPVPMAKLWLKARAEMRPGSLFISSTFSIPEQSPQQTLQVDDVHHSTLLIWRM